MAGPEGLSAAALSREVGLSQPTLSRWLRAARSVGGMNGEHESGKPGKSGGKGPGKARSKKHTTEDKLRLLGEASHL